MTRMPTDRTQRLSRTPGIGVCFSEETGIQMPPMRSNGKSKRATEAKKLQERDDISGSTAGRFCKQCIRRIMEKHCNGSCYQCSDTTNPCPQACLSRVHLISSACWSIAIRLITRSRAKRTGGLAAYANLTVCRRFGIFYVVNAFDRDS
jgi:hypothetical protein